MNRLLVISGPTATGKTELALNLARKYNGELISADSRQIYKGMDIGTGKDLPKDAKYKKSQLLWRNKRIGYYNVSNIRLWLYDIVDPDESFNVSDYYDVAWKVVKNIWDLGKQPIIVGGTGFYIKALVHNIDTLGIAENKKLRKELNTLNIQELQKRLKNQSLQKFLSMNNSDKNNPRRLVRAIEILASETDNKKRVHEDEFQLLTIGLSASKEKLYDMVDKRVDKRVNEGIIDEVKELRRKRYSWNLPSMSALGYKQWMRFLEGKESKLEVINKWKADEHNYVKRQMTWFKRDKRIVWYDITKLGYENDIINRVQNFYN